jgi:hypothetical protein
MSFINDLAPAAKQVGAKYNVLPSLLLSMAALESSYGQSGLAQRGKNIFSIKGSYDGRSISLPTKEYINNKWVVVQAKFKSYPGWAESLEDVCLLFANGVSWDRGKYHNVIGEKNIFIACHNVQMDGYATDPAYGDKLYKIVTDYNLTQYDNQSNSNSNYSVDPLRTGNPIVAQVKVIADNLNCRQLPDINSPVLFVTKKGQVYNVTANVHDWHEVIIDNNGHNGYLFGNNGKYLSLV